MAVRQVDTGRLKWLIAPELSSARSHSLTRRAKRQKARKTSRLTPQDDWERKTIKNADKFQETIARAQAEE